MSPVLFLLLASAVPGDSSRTDVNTLFQYATIFDSDGKRLVGLTRSGKLAVWDAKTGRLIRVLEGNRDPIVLARLSLDGLSVLGQSHRSPRGWASWGTPEDRGHERAMRLWSIRTGRVRWRVPDGLFDAFSQDGRRVYGVESRVSPNIEPARLACWDLSTGRRLFAMKDFAPRGYLTNIAKESPDGRRLFYADPSGTRVFDVAARKAVTTVPPSKSRLLGVAPAALTASGERFFLSGSPEDGVALFAIPGGETVDRALIPEGQWLASFGWLPRAEGFVAYGNGRWYSFRRGSGLRNQAKAGPFPQGIIVSPDERTFACWRVSVLDGKRWFWTEGRDSVTCAKLWERRGLAVLCLPNGELVVEDGEAVRFVDIATGQEKRAILRSGF